MTPRTKREKAASKEGFYGGVCVALQVLFYSNGGTTPDYDEIAGSCGPEDLIHQAKRDGNYASSGLKVWAKEQRDRERARRELAARVEARCSK